MTKTLKSTSCKGLPVDQSNSLRIGSSRHDAQTPLPPAHRKRTCFSLRSDTENVSCEGEDGGLQGKSEHNIHYGFFFLFFFLPQPFGCPHQSHGLCSSNPPTARCPLQGSSEWAEQGLIQEALSGTPANSSRLTNTEQTSTLH